MGIASRDVQSIPRARGLCNFLFYFSEIRGIIVVGAADPRAKKRNPGKGCFLTPPPNRARSEL